MPKIKINIMGLSVSKENSSIQQTLSKVKENCNLKSRQPRALNIRAYLQGHRMKICEGEVQGVRI